MQDISIQVPITLQTRPGKALFEFHRGHQRQILRRGAQRHNILSFLHDPVVISVVPVRERVLAESQFGFLLLARGEVLDSGEGAELFDGMREAGCLRHGDVHLNDLRARDGASVRHRDRDVDLKRFINL